MSNMSSAWPYRSFFFDDMDAIGSSQAFLPLVYPKARRTRPRIFGHGMETYQTQIKPFSVAEVDTKRRLDRCHAKAAFVRGLVKKATVSAWSSRSFRGESEATLRKTLRDADIEDALPSRALARAEEAGGDWRTAARVRAAS